MNDILNDSVPVYNVVVFALNNPLVFKEGEKVKNVLNLSQIQPYIESKQNNIDKETQVRIIEKIKSHHLSDVTLSEHIQNIAKFK